jgi:hypothetical protein
LEGRGDTLDLLSASSSAHKADAALAGGDPPQQRILVLAVEKGSRRKCSQCPELIDSFVVAGNCRLHAKYEPNTCNMGMARGIVKHGNGRARRNAPGSKAQLALPADRNEELPRQTTASAFR